MSTTQTTVKSSVGPGSEPNKNSKQKPSKKEAEVKVKVPTIEEMLKAGMHFGHSVSRWHPKMEPYIFTARNGIYIIDLIKSQKLLEKALRFIAQLAQENKTILWVGTKNQVKQPLAELAQEFSYPYVVERWLGGCLTNFTVIKRSIKKYKNLVEQQKAGKLDKYTKKERLGFEREIERLRKKVGGLVTMNSLPDAIFIWDVKNEKAAVEEARMKKIPIIGVCDTNSNPEGIDYLIPANDDATKTIKLILGVIREVIKGVKG